MCSVVPSVGVFGTCGVQCVFSVCVQSSHSHLDFKHSQLRREREGKRMGKRKQFSREVILEWNQWYRHSSGPSGMTLFLLRSHWPRAACGMHRM